MFNHLKDIVRYVHDTGFVDHALLVIFDDGEAGFTCMSRDSSMKIKGKYKNALPQLRDQKLGVARMDVLSAYLRSAAFSSEGDNTAPSIDVLRRPTDNTPKGIEIKSSHGHKAVFRFMHPQVAKSKITVTRTNAEIKDEDISFQPCERFLKDFVAFSSVLRKFNTNFSLEVEGDCLYMNMGEDDTARIPVSSEMMEGKYINPTYTWKIDNFLKVLKLAPTLEHVRIGVSEEYGVIEIIVDDENVEVTYHLTHN